MDISVSAAKGQLTELVRRAEQGEEVRLTRHGQPIVRLVPVVEKPDRAQRRAVLDKILAEARANPVPGFDAARSQDFLYDEDDGMPR